MSNAITKPLHALQLAERPVPEGLKEALMDVQLELGGPADTTNQETDAPPVRSGSSRRALLAHAGALVAHSFVVDGGCARACKRKLPSVLGPLIGFLAARQHSTA